jgi:NhaP-type Na+/H+ or K+/H+ antiporter
MEIGLSIFFILVILYTLFAARFDRISITMPMIFVVLGMLLGPYGYGLFQNTVEWLNIERFVEVTMVLLLFADASTLSYNRVRQDRQLPTRLLLIGTPLTIVLGGLVALVLFPGEKLGFALLLGTILAPTDAALGWPIFSNDKVPLRIRQALIVESGLNDGIATPFVTLFTALAVAESLPTKEPFLVPALLQIAIAIGIAVFVGLGGGWLFAWAVKRGWTSHLAEQIGGVALALAAYSTSLTFGGNGFIAAFVSGLLFGYSTRGQVHAGSEYPETTGTLFSLLAWTVFGAYAVGPVLQAFNPLMLIFAIFALTLVRMVPVAIAALGSKFRGDTLLVMGWFGPRGLASVVFTLIAMESFHEAGRQVELLVGMSVWTILLSVFLHGLTAVPLANWYAKRLENAGTDMPEQMEVGGLKIHRKGMTIWDSESIG